MSLFWLCKLHSFWYNIIQILSLKETKAEKVPMIEMKNIYLFENLSDAEDLYSI